MGALWPMVSRKEGQKLMRWLEGFQVHQCRKLAIVKALMADESMVDKSTLDLEIAMTLKVKEMFPNLPDDVAMGVIPRLEQVKSENFGARLPWNRHKRRKVQRARNIILHIFSGPDQRFWERQCSTRTTEVLCVDIDGAVPADLHNKNTFAYFLTLCASGRVKAIIGGPPCRTISALRYQNDGGPGVLRDDQFPYGIPGLSAADQALVTGDVSLLGAVHLG